MKKIFIIISLVTFLAASNSYAAETSVPVINQTLYERLKGYIILKVEARGEAYYASQKNQSLIFLGRPYDAFAAMRQEGIGITDAALLKIPVAESGQSSTSVSSDHKGKIFLQVQSKGEAWYVYPKDGKRYFLGKPSDAFALMKHLGVGISNKDFESLTGLSSVVGAPVTNRNTPPPLQVNASLSGASVSKEGIVAATNKARSENGGFAPYVENPLLDRAAAIRMEEMFEQQYFAHVSPEGVQPDEVVKSAGYEYIVVGENLAKGNFFGSEGMVDAWMGSPGHRANILHNRFTEIGAAVGIALFKGDLVWIGVQEFGLPRSACPALEESLKDQIDNVGNRITAKKAEAETQAQAIAALVKDTEQDIQVYNQKVNEYNALAAEIAQRIQERNALVAKFNKQVREINACFAG